MATKTTDRMNLRVSPRVKSLINEAADTQGTDVTSFMLEAATAKARRVLLEDRALQLTPAEVAQIDALLAQDAQPTAAFARAAQRLADLEG